MITEYDVEKGFASIFKAFSWGLANFYPDAKAMVKLPDILKKLGDTILISIAATTLAAVLVLFLALIGARTTRISGFLSIFSRGLASLFRNIPLVAWAMVLMLAFSQSDLTGYLALFSGSVGFLTRAFIETINEVSEHSVEALSAAGAAGIGFDLFMAGEFYFNLHEVGLITYIIIAFALVLEIISTRMKGKLQVHN